MQDKPTIRLKNWHISGAHVYGQDMDDNNKQVRSARIRNFRPEEADYYRSGDIIDTSHVNYVLVGLKRRKFSDD